MQAIRYCCHSRRMRHPPCCSLGRSAFSTAPSQHQTRFKSTAAALVDDTTTTTDNYDEVHRLRHLRNVGVFAHVDAGKTTVTERMLALAGVVKQAGCVDHGNTVTDFLPAERERGITIQSAAVSFNWAFHNNTTNNNDNGDKPNDTVTISLIDTPGHVDFSVEVNRSVAVLDGAVLVVDAAAGVQAQTETVWRAMTMPSLNNHHDFATSSTSTNNSNSGSAHGGGGGGGSNRSSKHEPLPCLAVVNKMDKVGSNFGLAIQSMEEKLPGAYPIPIQVPLFVTIDSASSSSGTTTASNNNYSSSNNDSPLKYAGQRITAVPINQADYASGEFVGVVDLVHMRAIIWPDEVQNNIDCEPQVFNLLKKFSDSSSSLEPVYADCGVTKVALESRTALVEALADCDEVIEEYYLAEVEPSNAEIRTALRRATLSHKALPVMAAAALRGRGVEPIIDSIADLLPSPLDRQPPALLLSDGSTAISGSGVNTSNSSRFATGHALHNRLLALAFKVVHMKGRGSGDGRVVFARVYSGELRERDVLQVLSPPSPGEGMSKPRTERVGGMLELSGGRFDNMPNGVCKSGSVCALVGLKSVVTGDTIMLSSDRNSSSKKKKKSVDDDIMCLAGVSSPKPVLTVRLEAETTDTQTRLSEALKLLSVEDPSLIVQETDATTLLSGLGELHIEIAVDRLKREFGLEITTGRPSVTHRETIGERLETDGLFVFDRMVGDHHMRAEIHIVLEPTLCLDSDSTCMVLAEPTVTIGEEAREFLDLDLYAPEEVLLEKSLLARTLVYGCLGALRRGPSGSYPTANLRCHIVNVNTADGLSALEKMPGALRAAAAHTISSMLTDNKDKCKILEPTMRVEISVPNAMVGNILSDITGRRGSVDEVLAGSESMTHRKSLIRGDVPLSEILGYANMLRSLTGGEGAFTAEYKGHSPIAQ